LSPAVTGTIAVIFQVWLMLTYCHQWQLRVLQLVSLKHLLARCVILHVVDIVDWVC